MQRFFDLSFKPLFLLTGLITGGAGALALFAPEWGLQAVFKLELAQSHLILIQHWGAMVSLVGLAMWLAALRSAWRAPILVFVGLEKACMALLVLSHWGQAYAAGFVAGAAMDAGLALYILAYFLLKKRAQS